MFSRPASASSTSTEDVSTVSGDDFEGLWEQISSSIDAIELEEVQRVVGVALVGACTDIYAEVRALREIHREYSAGTDEMVRSCARLPRATSSAPAGLVKLELRSLVAQLRARAAETGMPEEALLPAPSSPHRNALDSVLRDNVEIDTSAHDRNIMDRPGTADSHRLSLRDMRLAASRCTGSQDSALPLGSLSRPATGSCSSAASRPLTGTCSASSTASTGASPPWRSPGAAGVSCRSGCRAVSGRPASATSSAGSASSAGNDEQTGSSHGSSVPSCDISARSNCRPSVKHATERSRSGLVVSRLRAALEEERQALLAQAEALRLAIDDEHDYRGRCVQPPPSLTSLLELKRSLSEVLHKSEHVVAADAAVRGCRA